MSSRKRPVVPFVVAIFTLALSSALHSETAKAVEVSLELDGKRVSSLGLDACAGQQLAIKFPQAITNKYRDFRATVRSVDDDGQGGRREPRSACRDKLESGAKNPLEFSLPNPTVGTLNILPKSACTEGGGDQGGLKGSRVLCIYGEEGREELIAFAPINFNTEVAHLDSLEFVAVNGTISITAKVSHQSTPVKIEVCYVEKKPGTDVDDEPGCPSSKGYTLHEGNLTTEITGLNDQITYSLKVRIAGQKDKDGRPIWPIRFKAKPQAAFFPLKNFDGAGGELEWGGSGCQTTSNTSLLLFALVLTVMWFGRARAKKSTSMVLMMLAFTTLPGEKSHAEIDPGYMNFGLLGAMYRPALDNEIKADGSKVFPIYSTYFKRKPSDSDGAITPLLGVELDWHLWDGFGSLQLGLGIGYAYAAGHAFLLDANGKPDPNQELKSGSSSLHMYQLRPQLTYLFNPFADIVPLFPYVRGALIAHGYSFFENNKNVSSGSVKPNGFRFGYQVAVGLMLMLDFLEPSAVAEGRNGELLSHVYLKGELSLTKINSFGARGFDFSSKDVMGTSLPLMWTFGLVFEIPE